MKGKTVIVTGSGAGIGRDTALRFAREGADIVVNSLSDSAAAVRDEIVRLGGEAVFVRGDVSEEAVAERLVEETVRRFGGVDVLVNAAGIVPGGSVENTPVDVWDRAMAVNVRSVYLMSRFALPFLKPRHGCIINVASAVELKGVADRAAYSAAKGAVLSLSRSMAKEYIADHVRVNCVSPGSVSSPSFHARVAAADDPAKELERLKARQPIGYLGEPADVAEAILFLASDHAA